MYKVAIYPRVSTDEQARVEEGSIKNQITAARRHVEGENLKSGGQWGQVVGEYLDDGYSGSSLDRPGLKRLLLDISRRKVDLVIISELSRLSRSRRDWIDLLSFFKEHDVSFISLRQQVDTSTAVGRLLLNMLIDFAELELEQISERVTASAFERASRGLWIGGVPPYGLETTERNGYLKVNAAKKIIADEILDILVNRAGYLTKATQMIADAGYTRENGEAWSFQTLAKWVRSKAIIGEVEVNSKYKTKAQEKLSETKRFKVVKAVWEPLVDIDKWKKANELLDANLHKLKVPQWKHHAYLLSGILECEHARPFSGTSGTGQTKGKYLHYRHGKADIGKCPCAIGRVSAPKLEAVILKEIKKLSRTPTVVTGMVNLANEDFQKQKPDHTRVIAERRKKLTDIDRKLHQITDQVLEADSDEDKTMWMDKARQCRTQKDEIQAELKVLTREADENKTALLNADDIIQALTRFEDDFENLSVATRRAYLMSFLEKVVLEKTTVRLVVKGPNFAMESLGKSGIDGCKRGGRYSALSQEWLLRTGSNRRPSD